MDVGADAPEAGQDLRTALENAFKEAKEPPVANEQVVEPVDKSAPDVQARARDEQGRFARQEQEKQEKQQKQEKENAAASKTTAAQVTAQEIKQAPVTVEVTGDEVKAAAEKRIPAPPNSWSPEAKARWHELPQEVLTAIAQRESEFGKTAGKMDEERALGRDVQKVFQPYLALLQAEGTNPVQATASLLNTAYILRQGSPEQKRQAVLAVCKQHNIDLGTQAGVQSAQSAHAGNAAQLSPDLVALQNEVAQLKGMLSQGEQQSRSAAEAQIKQEIDAFSADPANVHYEEVKADMAALLSGGRAKDLKTAYDMACWARPDIRSSILAQKRAEEEITRKEQERQRAEEAKRKAVSVTGAPGAAVGANAVNRTLREELQANMAAARGAV